MTLLFFLSIYPENEDGRRHLTTFGFFVVVGSFFLFVAILYLISWYNARGDNYEENNYNEDIDPKLFILVTCLINADDNASTKEIEKVKQYILRKFKRKKAERYITYFKSALTKNIDLNKLVEDMNYELSYNAGYESTKNLVSRKHKVKWLHFLVSIATTDRLLSDAELEVLTIIRKGWDIHINTLNSILAMFNYYTDEDVNRQQRVKQYTTSSLTKYFTILEIKETAKTDEIKKSYRKLVQLYHPDKQINKTPFEQEQAEEQFKKIQEAYEIIKGQKGFN